MTYQETLDYLFSQLPMFQRQGAMAFKKDLTNIRLLCAELDNPQDKFPSIHIAGTNGKGSVTHLLGAIFQAAGYKVGLYTSPHYKDFRERIKINGTYISESYVINFVQNYKDHFNKIKPSFFEITVAMAFDYFASEKVDIAIIETGLGGRLDSTNIITPLLSVITNIGLDHIQFLGETLPEIAGEKAGIIKENIPVVIGEKHPETESVFRKKAKEQNAPIYFAEENFNFKLKKETYEKIIGEFYLQDEIYIKNIEINLSGKFQNKNITTAIQAFHVFKNNMIKFNLKLIMD